MKKDIIKHLSSIGTQQPKLFTLSNGIRVVIENYGAYPVAAVGVLVPSGGRFENKKTAGLSHFMEHMLFQGTEHRASNEIAAAIENVGGEFLASTYAQYTIFSNHLSVEQIPLSIEILADMIRFPLFKPELIASEAKVVAQEIYASLDKPQRIARNSLLKAIYGKDPLANIGLGTVVSINTFTQKDFITYHREHFLTSGLVISLAGKIDISKILPLLENAFGKIPASPAPAKWKTPVFSKNTVLTPKDIDQVHIMMGLPGYPVYSKKAVVLSLLASVFGGNMSSRLFRKLRYEEPLVYNIGAYPIAYTNAGYLNIFAETSPKNGEKVQRVLTEEIVKMQQAKITPEELRHAKDAVFGERLIELEACMGRMYENACSLYLRDAVSTVEEQIEQIYGTTVTEVNEVIDETFDLALLSTSIVQNS
jgi:predicted Zn-dependent peptidase